MPYNPTTPAGKMPLTEGPAMPLGSPPEAIPSPPAGEEGPTKEGPSLVSATPSNPPSPPAGKLSIDDILAMNPIDIAGNDEIILQLIQYYREVRVNVAQLEAEGKTITKKASRSKQAKAGESIDLSTLVKDS